jgi:hypothetical protein
VAAAHGRRWHQGGGIWRSVHKDAEAIEDAAVLADRDNDDDAPRVELGVGVAGAAPGETPALDQVLPEAGWIDADVGAAADLIGQIDAAAGAALSAAGAPSEARPPKAGDPEWASFRLAERPESDEFYRLCLLAGVEAIVEWRAVKILRAVRRDGELCQVEDTERQRWLTVPTAFVRDRAQATLEELREVKRQARELRQAPPPPQ